MFIEDNLSQLSFFNDLLLYLLYGSVTLFFNSDLFIYGLTNLTLEKESNIKKVYRQMDEKKWVLL